MSNKDTFVDQSNLPNKTRIIALVVVVVVCASLLVAVGYQLQGHPLTTAQTKEDFKFIQDEEIPRFSSQAFRIFHHAFNRMIIEPRPKKILVPPDYYASIEPGSKVNLKDFMVNASEFSGPATIGTTVSSALSNLGVKNTQSFRGIPPSISQDDFLENCNEKVVFLHLILDDKNREGQEWFSKELPNFIPIAMAVDADRTVVPDENKTFLVYLLQGDGTWTMFDDVKETKTTGISEAKIKKLVPAYILYRNQKYAWRRLNPIKST